MTNMFEIILISSCKHVRDTAECAADMVINEYTMISLRFSEQFLNMTYELDDKSSCGRGNGF